MPTPEEPGQTYTPTEDDLTAVADEEWLLRRFLTDSGKWDPVGKLPQIQSLIPTRGDSNGVSLNREGVQFLNAEQAIALGSRKMQTSGGVFAIQASVFRAEQLTLKPDGEGSPGHVLVEGLSRPLYDADSEKMRQLIDRLLRHMAMRRYPGETTAS